MSDQQMLPGRARRDESIAPHFARDAHADPKPSSAARNARRDQSPIGREHDRVELACSAAQHMALQRCDTLRHEAVRRLDAIGPRSLDADLALLCPRPPRGVDSARQGTA